MAQKQYSDRGALRTLLQIETAIALGSNVAKACHLSGVTDSTYYAWRKKYGRIYPPIIKRVNDLEENNAQLHQILSDITSDMQALQKRLKQLRPSHEDRIDIE